MNKRPNFLIVGVVKGGTTSLHSYLSQHIEVYMSPIKEANYFSDDFMDFDNFARDYKHDIKVNLDKYLESDMREKIHIAHVRKETDYLKLFRNVKGEKAIGEASNSYLLYKGVANRIKSFNDNMKIIMMLRNPVERAFSQYQMNLKQGKILDTSFIEEVISDDKKEKKGWGVNHQYLSIGLYYNQVKSYLDIFDRDKVLILFYDDYKKDSQDILRRIYSFLDIDNTFKADISKKLNTSGSARFKKINFYLNHYGVISFAKRIFPRSIRDIAKKGLYSEKKDSKLSDEDRNYLIEYYMEDINKLQELIGEDLSHWLK